MQEISLVDLIAGTSMVIIGIIIVFLPKPFGIARVKSVDVSCTEAKRISCLQQLTARP